MTSPKEEIHLIYCEEQTMPFNDGSNPWIERCSQQFLNHSPSVCELNNFAEVIGENFHESLNKVMEKKTLILFKFVCEFSAQSRNPLTKKSTNYEFYLTTSKLISSQTRVIWKVPRASLFIDSNHRWMGWSCLSFLQGVYQNPRTKFPQFSRWNLIHFTGRFFLCDVIKWNWNIFQGIFTWFHQFG